MVRKSKVESFGISRVSASDSFDDHVCDIGYLRSQPVRLWVSRRRPEHSQPQ
jgi:hypothetical protein